MNNEPDLRFLSQGIVLNEPVDDNGVNHLGKPNWVYNTCEAINDLAWASDNIENGLGQLKVLAARFDDGTYQGILDNVIDMIEEGYEKLESGYNNVGRIPTCGSWPKVPDRDKAGC
jgi:hypothetical protein